MSDSEERARTLAARRGGLSNGFQSRKERLEKAVANARALKNEYAVSEVRRRRAQLEESLEKIEECIIEEDELDRLNTNTKRRQESLKKYQDLLKEAEAKCHEVELLTLQSTSHISITINTK